MSAAAARRHFARPWGRAGDIEAAVGSDAYATARRRLRPLAVGVEQLQGVALAAHWQRHPDAPRWVPGAAVERQAVEACRRAEHAARHRRTSRTRPRSSPGSGWTQRATDNQMTSTPRTKTSTTAAIKAGWVQFGGEAYARASASRTRRSADRTRFSAANDSA